MLNDVAVGTVFEHPAGKDAPPFVVGVAAHIELHESAGVLKIFPRCGLLAGTQADNGVADAQRLTRLHLEIAGDAVAFVEQADDGDAFLHWRSGQRGGSHGADRGIVRSFRHRTGPVCVGHILRIRAAAGRQQEREQQEGRGGEKPWPPRRTQNHDASGLQAS
ncbi:hypothetical protein FHS92_002831 [Sphingobium subterraneum]|uniref:Uncharacterized protein n=1 Tax=Sphingobium subterraneum TaxID=627688 RepID=A0A841J2V5_9SPHN|nr:hypothetical protein [Sphingobium subterraneum]